MASKKRQDELKSAKEAWQAEHNGKIKELSDQVTTKSKEVEGLNRIVGSKIAELNKLKKQIEQKSLDNKELEGENLKQETRIQAQASSISRYMDEEQRQGSIIKRLNDEKRCQKATIGKLTNEKKTLRRR